MTGLQKEANKKLNLSTEVPLNIAQSLYEKKFITYPRIGSKYIPEDVWDEIPSALNAKENAVYDMIAFRLLEALSGACIKDITDVALQALQYDFTAKGCKVLEAGWRSIKGNFSDDDTESVQDLPELKRVTNSKYRKPLYSKRQPKRLYFIPKQDFYRRWKVQKRK